MEEKKNKMGRPTKHSGDLVKFIVYLAKQGKTDEEIAKIVGISRSTLCAWKHKYPDFSDTLKDAKESTDELVEISLLKRALGYTHKDCQPITFKGSVTDVFEYDKHIPPDVTSCIFWLKNRQPDKWRDKQEIESDVSERRIVEVRRANSD